MTSLSTIVNDLNTYINTKGKIQRSTFIKDWHDLDNEFWLDLFRDAIYLDENTKHNLKPWTLANIEKLAGHIFDHRSHHKNLLNPDPKDMVGMPKALTHFDKTTTVKSVLWRTIMELREYYCTVHDIDLPNEDASIGKLKSTRDTFGELFDFR